MGNTYKTVHNVSDIHWHLIHIGDCLRRKCCWPELVKTSMVLTHKLDYQERGTRMDAQPCSWPFPHQATWLLYFYFGAPPLQCRFKRNLLECLAFNTHERGQKPPACLSALRAPLRRVDDLSPNQGFDFHKRLAKLPTYSSWMHTDSPSNSTGYLQFWT